MKTKSLVLLAVLFVLVAALTSCFLLEHNWVDANCTTPKTCLDCGATEGEPLGHTEEIVVGKAATCTEKGLTEGKRCSVCGEVLVAQEEIPVKAHTEEMTLGKPASCTETGLTEGKKCSDCGLIFVAQEEIPLADHKEEILIGRDSTCAKAGLTEGKKCSDCGEILVAQEELPLADHKEEILDGKEPTCTESGLTEGKKCSACGEILTAQEEIPAAHKEATVDGKAATCTETGLTEGKKCSVCHEILVPQNEISSLGHKDENKDFQCDVCLEDLCTDHTPAEPIVQNKIDATCTQSGSYESVVKCSVCGDEISREIKTIPTVAHTPDEAVEEGRVDSTCTVAGYYYNVVYCSVCKIHEIGRTRVDLELASHIPGAAATCTTVQECTVCHTELAPANGHRPSAAATCTAVQECTVCHTELAPMKEHTPGTAATCTAAQECTVCHTELAPENGHTWGIGETLLDVTTYTCNVCGVSKAESASFENKDNIFTNKQFVGTDAANAQVLVAGWFAGGGYEVLTDGKKSEEQVGRFSTLMNNTTAFMDATIDLGEKYALEILKFYIYETQESITEQNKKNSIGKDMLIQVYIDGEWYDVVNCLNNASLCEYLIITDGYNNDYLEFDLGGIVAEKIRFYISGAVATSGITYQEIECSGALLNKHTHTEEKLTGNAATCIKSGMTDGVWCPVCQEILNEQEVIPVAGHDWGNGVTENDITTYTCQTCGLIKAESDKLENIDNIFSGKTFVPSSDASANIYNSSYGYTTLTDGIIYQEGSGRYSSKSNGGKVEASIELGAVYSLSDFKIYLHKDGLSKFGTGLVIEVLIGDNWVPVINCETTEDLQKYWVDNPDSTTMDWLVFNLGGATTSSVKFTIPGQTSTGWTTVYEIECSGAAVPVTEPEPEGPKLIENVFTGKAVIPLSDTVSNFCSATWGYHPYIHMIDGDFATRYASAQNGGKSGATIDLGAVYDLYELTFYLESNLANFGTGLEIQVLFDGEWETVKSYTVDELSAFLTDANVLTIDLGGVSARGFKFIIAQHGSAGWTSFYEMTCSATESSKVEANYEPSLIENVFAGRAFVASSIAAADNVYAITHGYLALTDSILDQETKGRYSGKSAAGAVVGATLNLDGAYQLETFTIYLYKNGLNAFGTELKIEVFDPTTNTWKTVVNYVSADELNTYLKAAEDGEKGPKLVFDLNGVEASQVRFTMPAGTTSSYPSMHEIACTGYAK